MKFDTQILSEIADAIEKAADVAKAKSAQHKQRREFQQAGIHDARYAQNTTWAKAVRAAIAHITGAPPKARKGPGEDSEEFAMFWAAYPRKVGKGDARAAWHHFKCDAKLEPILRALGRARESADWLKDGGQYIPFPATWIRREGWSDELPGIAPKRIEKAEGDPKGWDVFLARNARQYEEFRYAIDWLKADFRAWAKEQRNA